MDPRSSLLWPLAACCRSPNRAYQVKGCCQSPLLPSTNPAGRHSHSVTLSSTPCGHIRFSPGPPPPGHPCSCSSRSCSCQALACAGHSRVPAGSPLRVQGLIPAGRAMAREAVQCLMGGSLSCCRWAAGYGGVVLLLPSARSHHSHIEGLLSVWHMSIQGRLHKTARPWRMLGGMCSGISANLGMTTKQDLSSALPCNVSLKPTPFLGGALVCRCCCRTATSHLPRLVRLLLH